jgi:hypothetical protein
MSQLPVISSDPACLNYQPSRRRRGPRPRVLIGGAVVLSILATAYLFGPRAWWKVQVLYWQSRCMTHTHEPETVVASNTVCSIPVKWLRLYALLHPPGLISDGTIYLHKRISPAGNRRLVTVDSQGFTDFTVHMRDIHVRVFRPATLCSPPSQRSHELSTVLLPKPQRIFAGESDAENASHFVFRYEHNGRIYIVDGWLQDDDSVKIEQRDHKAAEGVGRVVTPVLSIPSPRQRDWAAPVGLQSSGR